MRLALAMGCSIQELFERFGGELKWWIAYNELEPIGELRGDFRIAQLCALHSTIASEGKSRQSPQDFMPFLKHLDGDDGGQVRRQTDQEMIAIWQQTGTRVSE